MAKEELNMTKEMAKLCRTSKKGKPIATEHAQGFSIPKGFLKKEIQK